MAYFFQSRYWGGGGGGWHCARALWRILAAPSPASCHPPSPHKRALAADRDLPLQPLPMAAAPPQPPGLATGRLFSLGIRFPSPPAILGSLETLSLSIPLASLIGQLQGHGPLPPATVHPSLPGPCPHNPWAFLPPLPSHQLK